MTEDEKVEAETAEHDEQQKTEAAPLEMIEIERGELEKLQAERKEFEDKYWLLLAESENQRKRMQKERQEYVNYAVKNAVVEILQPLDNLDHALSFTDQMSDEVKNWAAGFQMILTQFKDALCNQGIKSYESLNQEFDPHLHEAVETLETDEHPDGRIVQEFAKGYKMGDRIIRPARVKVAKQPKPQQADEDTVNEKKSEEEQGE